MCGNVDPAVMEILRGNIAQLEVVEMAQRRGQHVKYVSDEEEEVEVGEVGANQSVTDLKEERFLRVLTQVNTRPHFNPPDYDGKLYSDEFLDWIMKTKKYFDF